MMNNYRCKGYLLTEEQADGIGHSITGEDLKIEAFAGSGKTFELEAISDALKAQGKRGLYTAFNKAIQQEAESKFPNNVSCRTAHSLAYRDVGRHYAHRFQKVNGWVIAQHINLSNSGIYATEAAIGNLILDTIRRFTFSADRNILPSHVVFLTEEEEGQEQMDTEHIKEMKIEVADYARQIWDKMIDYQGDIPVTHDVYLKLWALEGPKLSFDSILFDEAQDANAVILDVIQKQNHAQRIYVGDRYQKIYSWRGAINAMDRIHTTYTTRLSQSFRFGPAIADKANEILNTYLNPETPINIKGNPTASSVVVEFDPDDENRARLPDAVICRTNGHVVAQTLEYLEFCSIHIAGGTGDLVRLVKGAQDLQAGRKTQVADLALFQDWAEVQEFAETKSGADLKSFVKMVDKYGTSPLISILCRTEKMPQHADVVITTAHKAKGLEWNHVKLGSDFKYPTPDTKLDKKPPIPPEEVNILYVAITRALKELDITDCKAAMPLVLPFFKRNCEERLSGSLPPDLDGDASDSTM